MKTKCMSCGGPTKKMQAGGTAKKMQLGGSLPKKKMGAVRGIKKTISTIKKTISNIGKPKPTTPKMELGGSLETFQFGGGKRRARQQGSLPSRSSCGEKIKRRKKSWERQDKAGKVLKGVGTAAGVIGGIGLAGAAAYKKSTPFKNAVDELKGKLGFNQKGGIVKKYQNGGPTDSLKVIKKEGKLAVKTEKQKQAAAKKAAANAKKIAKAKENARLNLEWQKMTKDQKDSLFISERQKNW
jgi:hypothetical protein